MKTKINFIILDISTRGGGAERVLSNITNTIDSNRFDVTVFSLSGEAPAFYPYGEKTKIKFLGLNSRFGTLVKLKVFIFARFKLQGVIDNSITICFMRSSFLPLGYHFLGKKLALVASEHSTYSEYRTKPLQLFLYWLLAPTFKLITVTSPAVKSEFPARIRKNMVVVQNPVQEPSNRVLKRKISTETIKWNLLIVGRFVPEKNHIGAIKAFSIIQRALPNVTLTILGNGPLREEYYKYIKCQNLSNIIIKDFSSNVQAYYQASDLLICSSVFESFGMVVGEALSMGLPVIAYNSCTGAADQITHGINGILVDTKEKASERALAQAVIDLLTEVALFNRLAESTFKISRQDNQEKSYADLIGDLV